MVKETARGQAPTLSKKEFETLLAEVVKTSRRPAVDKAAFLLSYLAGLRVQEIAGLKWKKNVLNLSGGFRTSPQLIDGVVEYFPALTIGEDIGKYGQAREVFLHDDLFEALAQLRDRNYASVSDYVIPSVYAGAEQDLKSRAHALRVRINRIYDKLGFPEGTTHSGRRTFITQRARQAALVEASMEDVREMAGHANVRTTQDYVKSSPRQVKLARLPMW